MTSPASEHTKDAVVKCDPNHEYVVNSLRAIRRIIRSVDNVGKKTLAVFGVSGSQLTCLTVLFEEGTMSIQELSQHVFLSSGTLTGIIDRLERKDYVKRVRSTTDRRKIMLELSHGGRKLVEQAPHPLQLSLVKGLRNRDVEQNRLLCEQLESLVTMLEAEGVGVEAVLDAIDSEEGDALDDHRRLSITTSEIDRTIADSSQKNQA